MVSVGEARLWTRDSKKTSGGQYRPMCHAVRICEPSVGHTSKASQSAGKAVSLFVPLVIVNRFSFTRPFPLPPPYLERERDKCSEGFVESGFVVHATAQTGHRMQPEKG